MSVVQCVSARCQTSACFQIIGCHFNAHYISQCWHFSFIKTWPIPYFSILSFHLSYYFINISQESGSTNWMWSAPVKPESYFWLIRIEVVASNACDGFHMSIVLFQNFFVVFGCWWHIVHFLFSIKREEQYFINIGQEIIFFKSIHSISIYWEATMCQTPF